MANIFNKETNQISLYTRPISCTEDPKIAARSRERKRRVIRHIRGLISRAPVDMFCGSALDPLIEQTLLEAKADAAEKQATNELVIEALSADREAAKRELDDLILLISRKIHEISAEIDLVKNTNTEGGN